MRAQAFSVYCIMLSRDVMVVTVQSPHYEPVVVQQAVRMLRQVLKILCVS
jgi:hypothetical protein